MYAAKETIVIRQACQLRRDALNRYKPFPFRSFPRYEGPRRESLTLPAMQPVPVAAVPRGTVLCIVGAADAGFPSPAQD